MSSFSWCIIASIMLGIGSGNVVIRGDDPEAVLTSCQNSYGAPVEWFVGYKFPQLNNTGPPDWPALAAGTAFAYQTDQAAGIWSRHVAAVDDKANPVARTISMIYDENVSQMLTYVIYNNQPPPDENDRSNQAHAKGVVIFGGNTGIWLIHTVPGFPPPASAKSYSYNSSDGFTYGQEFLCMTLPQSQLNLVARQLYYDNVHIYDYHATAQDLQQNPALRLLLNRTADPNPPYNSTAMLVGVQGTKFVSFAKDARFNTDLYSNYVAPALKTGLNVEAWINDPDLIPSNCTGPYHVMNVNGLRFRPPYLDADVAFNTSLDIAKLAISMSPAMPWVCTGDLNHEYGHFTRGGGTVCLENAKTWLSYSSAVSGVFPCPSSLTGSKSIPEKNH